MESGIIAKKIAKMERGIAEKALHVKRDI